MTREQQELVAEALRLLLRAFEMGLRQERQEQEPERKEPEHDRARQDLRERGLL